MLREKGNLILILLKEGFDRLIRRSTLSSWIKPTVLLDFQSFNSDSQHLYIEAHIRSMSVST